MQKSIIMVLSMAAMLAACGQGTGTGAQGEQPWAWRQATRKRSSVSNLCRYPKTQT